MKLLIIGATGKIGALVTARALKANHHVVAVVLDKTKITGSSSDNITIIEGDATNADVISKALHEVDAVISTLGHNRYTTMEMQSNAMRVLVAAMHKNNVERVVSLTGAGVYTEGDAPNIFDRALTALLMLADTKRVQDGIKHVEVLKDSGLDWVVLRTPKHISAKAATKYRVTPNVKGFSWFVRRPNIADYLVTLTESQETPNRMPVITG